MDAHSWALSDDVSGWGVAGVVFLAVLAVALLALELRRRERLGGVIFATGVLAILLFSVSVLRPVRVRTRGSVLGPRVVVLLDESRRLLLPEGRGTRRDVALESVRRLRQRFKDARLSVLGFGEGVAKPVGGEGATGARPAASLTTESDLAAAIAGLAATPGERPEAVVVVSDGRLARPAPGGSDESLRRAIGALGVPVHTVAVAERAPKDASIRSVRAAGAAVAHQPLTLTVEVGCAGGLACGDVPVSVRELRRGSDPVLLASGVASVAEGSATVELTVTLERAGARVVELAIDAPDGDTIPENDRRILTFSVTRDRIRLLHVAGRPTYDVRALRMWLKSDESVDLVAFFILRTIQSETGTTDDSELALIPFPVDELFSEHLPSFDAVVLQDIDAVEYKLAQHLPALARYVEGGGGLIMVGGPSAFAGGGYAGTPLERVLPVKLSDSGSAYDPGELVPRTTEAGRAAPVLRALRQLYGDELPTMAGSNTLGPARAGSLVLWEHPTRRAGDGPMPVLALGEAGDGRAIALGVDETSELAFSELAERAAGRGYGALWDGLLGWLMRDPRFEAARLEVVGECVAGEPVALELTPVPGMSGDVELTLERLGVAEPKPEAHRVAAPPPGPVRLELGPLEVGGYTARARIGKSPPTRFDFACEKGGAAFSDSRPDPERLERIAEVTGGRPAAQGEEASLPLPEPKRVAAERHVTPLAPAWLWSLVASLALGAHWLARRRGGLA
ncbi:MAG: glutamine amidotransferase [Sorangiineae bacterium]|nr:glutamine amidotransferase [Polyangiaceae bacterium]MEB2323958.1 glutamine amidotransferase [Sorangiineae bacterium]